MTLSGWDRLLLTLLAAALYTLSFPPWGFGWLSPLALTPLALALDGLSIRTAAMVGLSWGTATIWGFGHWVPVALATYWGQPLWFGALLALIGSVVFMGSYGAGFAACAAVAARTKAGRRDFETIRRRIVRNVIVPASLWVSWEVARGWLLTGDPWLLLGYAFVPYPRLSQIADLGAVYLVSFVIALIGFALAEVVRSGDARALAVPVAALLITAGYGSWRLQQPLAESRLARIRVVQGNNDPGRQWRAEHYGQGLEHYLELSRRPSKLRAGEDAFVPEVLLWPESAVTFFLARETAHRQQIANVSRPIEAELIIGGPHYVDADPAKPRYFNSAFHLSPDATVLARYDKVHLLPFGEYFPLRTIQFLRRSFERVRTFTPGRDPRPFSTRLGRTAVVICFEAIFPELVRQRMKDADVLINLSNDAWLGDDAGPRQHAQMVAMRAIEARTWLVRATTTGVSSIIDPWGRTTAATTMNVASVLDGTVARVSVETMYERFGDVFAFGCIGISIAAVVRGLLRV